MKKIRSHNHDNANDNDNDSTAKKKQQLCVECAHTFLLSHSSASLIR